MTTKNTFSSARRALALEQRILFDGAGAAAGADAFDGDLDNPIDNKPQSHQNPQQQRVAQMPMPIGARLFAAPMAMPFSDGEEIKFDDTVKVGEDEGKGENEALALIGKDIKLNLGDDVTSITVSVGKGTLSGTDIENPTQELTLSGDIKGQLEDYRALKYRG